MNFKLDENFGTRTAAIFREFGYDIATVHDESLSGSADVVIFAACLQERRCLVTLDLDFADVVRFPPHETAGIAVVGAPKHASQNLLSLLIRRLLLALQRGVNRRPASDRGNRPNPHPRKDRHQLTWMQPSPISPCHPRHFIRN